MISIETLLIFVLACFVGYYVISKVTPALHAPLMSVTNAISSVIIVIALDAALIDKIPGYNDWTFIWGVAAVFLVTINIVGGFMLTKRMLSMFNKKK
ncbi:MAG: NAD(P) transhydrogenase subunit alpha [Alphaproteobacteria bacterium]|nr:NAD(P) transhydrogenase subunit alpha [Alphaproteobacteria bacterium]